MVMLRHLTLSWPDFPMDMHDCAENVFVMHYYHVIITKVIQLTQCVKINESSRYNHVHSPIILHHIWQYTTLLPTSQ